MYRKADDDIAYVLQADPSPESLSVELRRESSQMNDTTSDMMVPNDNRLFSSHDLPEVIKATFEMDSGW